MSLAPPPAPAEGERPWRWVIIGLIFSGTLVNYIDRQTISVLAPVLCRDLHLSNTEYGLVGSAFLFTYALSMWLWGGVFDWIGNRAGYALAIAIWSVSEIAHAAARGLASLSVFRGCLGIGESGNWPGATRTIAAWFAPRERALGMGIANTGASIGPAISAPLIVWLDLNFGWRITFVATGAFGILWLVFWTSLYPRHRAATPRQTAPGPAAARGLQSTTEPTAAPARENEYSSSPEAHHRAIPWGVLLRRREVWGIIMARFFGDPIWWLYLVWLPKYLADARHFSMAQIGAFAWVPFLFAALGALSGGWLSGFLIRRGRTVHAARTTAIVFATVLLPVALAAAFVPTAGEALACISATLFAFQFWVGNVQTLPSDFFPVGAVGSIAGFAGTAAGLGSMLLIFCSGWVVDHFSYTPMLVVGGVLGPVATTALYSLCGRIRRIPS